MLNCNDPGEYSNVFGHCKITPKENPGRGLLMADKRFLEYQVAMFGKDAREADRSKALMEYIEQRNSECSGKAAKIPMVPDKLSLATTMAENVAAFRNKGIVPVGMNFATVALTSLNIASYGSISLLGDSDSREAFVRNFMVVLSKTAIFHNVNALVVDDRFKKLRNCESYGFVRQYTADPAEGLALISDFCDEVRRRKDDDDNEDIKADIYTALGRHAQAAEQKEKAYVLKPELRPVDPKDGE